MLLTCILGSAGTICFKIWYVDSPSLEASQQQIWLNSGKRSQTYIGVKITFFGFLSINSRGGVTASWAERHTTMCLDYNLLSPNGYFDKFSASSIKTVPLKCSPVAEGSILTQKMLGK